MEKRNFKNSFILGTLVGVIVFLVIYGIDVLDFTNVEWLTHSNDLEGLWDLSQHYYGWEFYRKTPWTFPIGLLYGISPDYLSIVYTDSIPLFAVFFKLLSPILPESFQYFGLFELCCYGLLGGFGALALAKKTDNYLLQGLFAYVLVISPVLTKRVFYHSALSAHFLIIMAFCLWVYEDMLSTRKQVALWSVTMFLAVTINAYYLPMVGGVLCLKLFREFFWEKKRLQVVWYLGASGLVTVFTGYCLGMFYGSVSSSAENLEKLSFNLISFINPRSEYLRHGEKIQYEFVGYRSYSIFFDGWNNYREWQNEGFAYLGLGIIFLTIVALVFYLRNRKGLEIKKGAEIAIILGIVGFTLLALGPQATIGTHSIYFIHWPERIYKMFAIFRTEGRLIWPVYYGIILFVFYIFSEILKKGNKKVCVLVLAGCVLLQTIDLYPSLLNKHDTYEVGNHEYESVLLQSDVMCYLGEMAEEIVFVPDVQYNPSLWPYWSCVFEEFCLRYNLKMNGAYCSRNTWDIGNAYANQCIEDYQSGNRDDNKIYVSIFEGKSMKNMGLKVYKINGIYIGTDRDLSGFNVLEYGE